MMDILKSLTFEQIQAAVILIIAALASVVTIAEIVVRLTPTTSDDGAVKRIGERIDKMLDLLGVPNKRKQDDPPVPSEDKKE